MEHLHFKVNADGNKTESSNERHSDSELVLGCAWVCWRTLFQAHLNLSTLTNCLRPEKKNHSKKEFISTEDR